MIVIHKKEEIVTINNTGAIRVSVWYRNPEIVDGNVKAVQVVLVFYQTADGQEIDLVEAWCPKIGPAEGPFDPDDDIPEAWFDTHPEIKKAVIYAVTQALDVPGNEGPVIYLEDAVQAALKPFGRYEVG